MKRCYLCNEEIPDKAEKVKLDDIYFHYQCYQIYNFLTDLKNLPIIDRITNETARKVIKENK